jgi:hypothetical protein
MYRAIATAPPLPTFARATVRILALYQDDATGAQARLFKCAEVTRTSTSPEARRVCACGAAIAPSLPRGKTGKNAEGRPGWQEGKQQQQ